MFSTDWLSYSPPMKTWTARAAALALRPSSMSRASCSSESSLRMLGPPLARSTVPRPKLEGMVVRRIPRVSIRASQ